MKGTTARQSELNLIPDNNTQLPPPPTPSSSAGIIPNFAQTENHEIMIPVSLKKGGKGGLFPSSSQPEYSSQTWTAGL